MTSCCEGSRWAWAILPPPKGMAAATPAPAPALLACHHWAASTCAQGALSSPVLDVTIPLWSGRGEPPCPSLFSCPGLPPLLSATFPIFFSVHVAPASSHLTLKQLGGGGGALLKTQQEFLSHPAPCQPTLPGPPGGAPGSAALAGCPSSAQPPSCHEPIARLRAAGMLVTLCACVLSPGICTPRVRFTVLAPAFLS